jgi:hypothetical protein
MMWVIQKVAVRQEYREQKEKYTKTMTTHYSVFKLFKPALFNVYQPLYSFILKENRMYT